MANIKKVKATRAQPINKKSKPASKNPDNKASFTTDTSVASPTTPPTPSAFLALPPEMRNEIYRYALVVNGPIKVQFEAIQRGRRGRRCFFNMLPGLATVSKQVRLESQRIYFEENLFEIPPEMFKPRNLAPLMAFQTMHHRLGVDIRSLRVCHELKKRCDGDLFLLKACFTVSKAENKELSITDSSFSATFIGPSAHARARAVPQISVCGCSVVDTANDLPSCYKAGDIVHFLKALKENFPCGSGSYHFADLECYDEDIWRGESCSECVKQGLNSVFY